ncbi:MAG: family 10 glycosylhydrolase [Kiritimatiellia bacterium]
MRTFLILALQAAAVSCAGGRDSAERNLPPLPAGPGYRLAQDISGANPEDISRAWVPMKGSPPVSVVKAGAGRALKMTCPFAGTDIPRASWDLEVDLDLSSCRGLWFRFLCPDPSPVSHFTFYLKSGAGWYARSFSGHSGLEWETVEIDKSETEIEGSPAGWGKIEKIRISAWRGGTHNTEFYMANPGLLGGSSPLAVIRADSAAERSPEEVNSVVTYSRNVTARLRDLGIEYGTIADTDLSESTLRGKRLVILPHNPNMPPAAVETLKRFLGSGGRIICFYLLPPGLESVTGIKNGKFLRESYNGQFASMRATGSGPIAGLPERVPQDSWNIYTARPAGNSAEAAAYWFDINGRNTREPAVIVSGNCILVTHVLVSDAPEIKSRMLLAMAGHFLPSAWKEAAENALEEAGNFGPYEGWNEAVRSLRGMASSGAGAGETFAEALSLHNAAGRALEEGNYRQAFKAASEAGKSMVRTYAAAQKPLGGERRALWCHDAFGVRGMSWEETAATAAKNGFNMILANMLWGGTAYYESEVLPRAREIASKGDQVKAFVTACRKKGLECHVWKVNWYMGGKAPEGFAERMKREGRTQKAFSGSGIDRWLCPSHPENRKLEIESMLEVVRNYDVDGIHMDYIRYPGREGCFCQTCRRKFEKKTGQRVSDWPRAVRADARLRSLWLDFRRENITGLVAELSGRARSIKPEVEISAAVFRNWEEDRNGVGQDWRLWCRKGYVDFVCPMDYTADTEEFESYVRSQKALAGNAGLLPGIGLSTWTGGKRAAALIEQVLVTRRHGAEGFAVFELNRTEAEQVLPLCALGVTRRE